MKLHEIINLLAETSKTNEKKKILEDNKNNELLKLYFKATLDPFINYFIRVKEVPDDHGHDEITVELIARVIGLLSHRMITGNAARDFINERMVTLTKEDQILLKNMINHDPNCKVAEGLVNKTWKDLIPEFPCMLAETYNEKTKNNIKEGKGQIVVQKKEDGGRVEIVVKEDGSVTFYSRNGNILETHGVFDDIFSAYTNQVFDGELLVISDDGVQDRKTGNGIFNKAVRGTISKEEAEKLHVVLWDLIPLDKWNAGYDSTHYIKRLEALSKIVATTVTNKISVVETKIVDTIDEALVFYIEKLSEGEEGAMIKNIDMPWENRRSKFMLKLKSTKSTTLLCVDVKPHSKNPSLIGSLECVTSDNKLRVSIGSGLKQLDREKDPSEFIGSLIDVMYNMLIIAKGSDEYALFLPRYNGYRLDQTQADTLEHIKDQE